MNWLFALAAVLTLAVPALADTHVWQRWETPLEARAEYKDPYRDVELNVKFEGPAGKTFDGVGFWDGKNTFKVRAAFPSPGQWRWTTASNKPDDKGLHGQSGLVDVKPYDGKNPLYTHGFLKVSDNKRYVTFADATPFLWIGDTSWFVNWNATRDDWKDYLDIRPGQGFTLTMMHAMTEPLVGQEKNVAGLVPFDKNGLPTQEYWEAVAGKIEMANAKGLVVLLAGLGRGAKTEMFARQTVTPEFARYIVGRTSGNFVIYSASVDAPYSEQNDRLGQMIRAIDKTHLLTNHVGTDFEAAKAYHPKDYIDIAGYQSGHHNGSLESAYGMARWWGRSLYAMKPIKPVINLEGQYDGRGTNVGGGNWREQDVRKIGWLSFMSGAAGYNYGAGELDYNVEGTSGGVFMFGRDPAAWDHWKKAIKWESATQMGHLATFLKAIEWWRLEPAQDLIKNQAKGEHARRAVAKSASGDLLVAYLPYGGSITLDLREVKSPMKARWYDPLKGTFEDATGDFGGKEQRFAAPARGDDWVLLLQPK